MAEPFIGEIRMFAGTFAPRSWAICNGDLLSVSQNTALFSLIGTIYGGDGRTTFGLPDLRSRLPLHYGEGPGLSNYQLGAKRGQETVTLVASELPSHTHALQASTLAATTNSPAGNVLAASALNAYTSDAPDLNFSGNAISTSVGGGGPHINIKPLLGLNFIIALFGIYPSRT